jgi:hypothetical protein
MEPLRRDEVRRDDESKDSERSEIRFGAGPRARKDIDAAKRSAGRCGRLRGRGWRRRTWEEGETLV